MAQASAWFVLGFMFCAVLSGALLIALTHATGGDAGEDPERGPSR